MAQICYVTGKTPLVGNNRSHAKNATRRRWNVNMQTATVLVDGVPTRVKISARGLKTLKKTVK